MPKRVLVVDDDEVVRNLVRNHLQRMGVEAVDDFDDGAKAWQALESTVYDFIVLDWKLPGMAGMALFNRIRARAEYRTTPVLVVSGFLEKYDFRLLQEFPCTGLVEKPFTKVLFENRVEELAAETTWYGQNLTLIDSLLEACKGSPKRTEALLKEVFRKAPNPIPLAVLAAKRLAAAGELRIAERILKSVLKMDGGCVIAMNELGKILHRVGKHEEALDTLREAHRLSPQNVARLCLLGEVELNLRDPESARGYFEQALGIDSESARAKAGIIVSENMSSVLDGADPDHIPRSFASMLNTIGIGFVRSGQYEKGIEQYRAAMAFLHSPYDNARLAFNLGLGFLRWGKTEQALTWFQKSAQLGKGTFSRGETLARSLELKLTVVQGGAAAAEVAEAPEVSEAAEAKGGEAAEAAEAPEAPEAPEAAPSEELEIGGETDSDSENGEENFGAGNDGDEQVAI